MKKLRLLMDIQEGVKSLHRALAGKEDVIAQYREIVADLRAQVKDLSDRVMSANYQVYKTFSDVELPDIDITKNRIFDEDAGEILEVDDAT